MSRWWCLKRVSNLKYHESTQITCQVVGSVEGSGNLSNTELPGVTLISSLGYTSTLLTSGPLYSLIPFKERL